MLTSEEILKMEPGPKLDTLVAEKVMGWRCTLLDNGHGYPAPFWTTEGNVKTKPVLNWSPSTHISAAWEVFEWLIRKHDDATITYPWCVVANYNPMTDEAWGIHVDGDTAPEAICKASLLSILKGCETK